MRRRVWHSTYEGNWSSEAIDELFDGNVELSADRIQEWVGLWINLLAVVDGEIVGAAGSGVLPDGEGELVSLNVLPRHHGTGVGQQLWDATVDALRERDCTSMQIWVVASNARAIRFYEKQGALPFASGKAFLDGVPAEEVGYRFAIPNRAPFDGTDR